MISEELSLMIQTIMTSEKMGRFVYNVSDICHNEKLISITITSKNNNTCLKSRIISPLCSMSYAVFSNLYLICLFQRYSFFYSVLCSMLISNLNLICSFPQVEGHPYSDLWF